VKLLDVKNLTKRYGKRTVVNKLCFDVGPGEIVGLLGPNGAGKTTAFRMTIGMIRPENGQVFFHGEDITKLPMFRRARRGMGYLAQEPSIIRGMTVGDNLMSFLEMMRYPQRERLAVRDQLLSEFGLKHLLENMAYTLSGGERRRLEIARALIGNPSLILLDEPFTGIDPIAVAEIQDIVQGLREKGMAVLITDHNVRDALTITDRSYVISEGAVVSSGTTEEIVHDPLARRFYLGERLAASVIEEQRPGSSRGANGSGAAPEEEFEPLPDYNNPGVEPR